MKFRADFNKNSLESGEIPDIIALDKGHQAFFQEQSRLDVLESLGQLVLSEGDSQVEGDSPNCLGILLLGNKGIGKTSLIREFVDFHAEKLNINVALIDAEETCKPNASQNTEPQGSDVALYSSILLSLGMTDSQCNTPEAFQKSFMDIARYSRECGRSVMVIIDNAHRLSSENVSELLLVNNVCNEMGSPAYWVFASEPGLERVFQTLSQKHKGLKIEQSFHTLRLHAFNLEDTERFINFSCEHAGISNTLNLQAGDIKSIYNASQGNPGLIPKVIRRVLSNSNSPKNIFERIPRVHKLASTGVALSVGFFVFLSAIIEGNVGKGLFLWDADKYQLMGGSVGPTKIEWFLEQNPRAYTIQLISGENMGNIDKYMGSYESEVGSYKLYKLKTIRDGKDWYLVFCGLFDDKASALAFGQKLPESMQTTRPWVRSFQHVQQEIQNNVSVSVINQ